MPITKIATRVYYILYTASRGLTDRLQDLIANHNVPRSIVIIIH